MSSGQDSGVALLSCNWQIKIAYFMEKQNKRHFEIFKLKN